MGDQYSRSRLIFGGAAMERLKNSRVAVFGLGGVGGSAAEALARGGVGALDLVDNDVFSPSNLNRQIFALRSTVGVYKTDAAAARIADIDPDCRVTLHRTFFLPENADSFDFSLYDYVVDAVDTVTAKLAIIMKAKASGVPVISCMGTGNKVDPSALKVADISGTSVCPLARVMRKALRARGVDHVTVVYSTEAPIDPDPEAAGEAPPPGRRSLPGSTSFVPGAAGLLIASRVILDLTGFDPGDRRRGV